MTSGIHLVVAADAKFFPGLAVTVASALATLPMGRTLNVHVLDGGLSPAMADALRRLAARIHPAAAVEFHPVDEARFDGFHSGIANSRMYYARLLVGSLIAADRALYLDVDVVVLDGLDDLWDREMGGNILLAAADRKIARLCDDCPWPLSDAEAGGPYFNTGVLLMDLARWREERIGERAMQLAGEAGGKCRWHDQTALNYLLRGRIGGLPDEWNWQREDLPEDPAIRAIHFTTGKKPWRYPGPDARFRVWRAFYRFACGPTRSLFLRRQSLPGLLHAAIETAVRCLPTLRAAYLLLLQARLLLTPQSEKKQAVAGTIAYFTTGPGGPKNNAEITRSHPTLLKITRRLAAIKNPAPALEI